MPWHPVPKHDARQQADQDDGLQHQASFAKQFPDVDLLDGKVLERGGFRSIEKKDHKRVKGIER